MKNLLLKIWLPRLALYLADNSKNIISLISDAINSAETRFPATDTDATTSRADTERETRRSAQQEMGLPAQAGGRHARQGARCRARRAARRAGGRTRPPARRRSRGGPPRAGRRPSA